jgi:uncharacterized integral membrane protein
VYVPLEPGQLEPGQPEAGPVEVVPPEAHADVATPVPKPSPRADTPTRASGLWAAVVGGLAVLVVLIVFILENTDKARVEIFGAHWHLPIGIALLIAAVFGGFVVVLAGTARILELRRRERAERRRNSPTAPRGRHSDAASG